MRIRFFTILLLLLSVLVFSCQKEIQPFDPSQPPITDTTNNGGDTSSVNSYQPLTTGSWWKYQDSATGAISLNTVASSTKTINGILHNALIATSDIQTDTVWTAAPRPNYYLVLQGASPNTGAAFDLTFHYLNDTASVGYNWQYNAGSGGDFTAYITTTIVAKNLTMTIGGKTYTNVIQTRLDLSYDIFGTLMDYGYYEYFTAQGVGILKIRAEIRNMGVPVMQTCSDLIDYSIQ